MWLIAGAFFFVISFEGGAFAVSTRTAVAVGVWWAIAMLALSGFIRWQAFSIGARASAGLLAAYTAWTLASLAWSPSAQIAFDEFARTALYLGLFILAAAIPREVLGPLANGIAAGLSAIAVLALVSRFFPHSFSTPQVYAVLGAARLSYPLNYWNGLAIVVGLAVPLLLRAGIESRTALGRGVAIGTIPAIACTIDFASSRSGVLAVGAGFLALFALARRRWALIGSALVAGAGSAAAIEVLVHHRAVVERPYSAAALAADHRTALFILVTCAVTGAVAGALEHLPRLRVPRALNVALLTTVAAAALFVVALSHPIRRFDAFKAPPSAAASSATLQAHILGFSGTGRWQQWQAAVQEFRAHPVAGGGAGSWGSYWLEHGSLATIAAEAHSLYLETLAELGLVGLVLLVGAIGTALVAGVRRRTFGPDAFVAAALLAAAIGYLVAAAVEWIWELPAVTAVGFVCLGLAISRPAAQRLPVMQTSRQLIGVGLRVGFVLCGAAIVACEAVPFLVDAGLHRSKTAAAAGNLPAARNAAASAAAIQPWAASPYVQLALVDERAGDLPAALHRIGQAIARDPADWTTHLIAARLNTKAGAVGRAERELAEAARLNPHAAIFQHG